jgi:cellulose synthase/poly-beta-1,6-N-acetylglucosamine synthase-like glycosyltransferase
MPEQEAHPKQKSDRAYLLEVFPLLIVGLFLVGLSPRIPPHTRSVLATSLAAVGGLLTVTPFVEAMGPRFPVYLSVMGPSVSTLVIYVKWPALQRLPHGIAIATAIFVMTAEFLGLVYLFGLQPKRSERKGKEHPKLADTLGFVGVYMAIAGGIFALVNSPL